MPKLYVLSGDDLGRSYEVRSDSVVLGRGRDADLVIRGGSVSRVHARLERADRRDQSPFKAFDAAVVLIPLGDAMRPVPFAPGKLDKAVHDRHAGGHGGRSD